jgi:hypothetical protein
MPRSFFYTTQVTTLAAAAAAAGTPASGRLADTFKKIRDEFIVTERPAAPTGVEEPPFGP